ncbi:MAG TPA: hypothetical protein VMN60_05985 [Longimicrobiales bacterium]|nr:hypothetical protein [Longimicrobiales bacterium]
MAEPRVVLEPELRARLDALYAEGRAIFEQFDRTVRKQAWHPFIPADYESILQALLPYRGRRMKFLEWGSATGVIAITADLLGFEAYGIEIDERLVVIARELAAKYGSNATFAAGSFLPDGYEWRSEEGDPRLGTIGVAPAGYSELGVEIGDFDLVYAYLWSGEEPIVHDVMRRFSPAGARLLLNGPNGVRVFTFPEPVA